MKRRKKKKRKLVPVPIDPDYLPRPTLVKKPNMIVKDINPQEYSEFKCWCIVHGYTMTGVMKVLIREVSKDNIDLTKFNMDDAHHRKPGRKPKRW